MAVTKLHLHFCTVYLIVLKHSSQPADVCSTFSFSDRLSHQARISASVNAMRILNTGTDVEAAVADALVRTEVENYMFYSPYTNRAFLISLYIYRIFICSDCFCSFQTNRLSSC